MTNRRRRSSKEREAICIARGWTCHICGGVIHPGREKWELDHVIPLASGGSDDDANISPAHAKCHLGKTCRDIPVIAKGERVRAKHMGLQIKRPFPGGRKSKWKRKISGEVVER